MKPTGSEMTEQEKQEVIKEGNSFTPATPEEVESERERLLTPEQKTILSCKAVVEYCIRQEVFKKTRSEYDSNIIGAAFQVVEMDIQKLFKELFNGVEIKNIIIK